MELLIAEGADISARDAKGSTALSVAAESGHRRAAELLIAKGADIGTRDLLVEPHYTGLL